MGQPVAMDSSVTVLIPAVAELAAIMRVLPAVPARPAMRRLINAIKLAVAAYLTQGIVIREWFAMLMIAARSRNQLLARLSVLIIAQHRLR